MSEREHKPFDSPDEPGVMLIPLTRNQFAKIDAADCELVSQYMWCASNTARPSRKPKWYAKSNAAGSRGYLHRLIMNCAMVDHMNGDGLDCRRSNMRPATRAQNNANRSSVPGSSSQFLGVFWDQGRGKWRAAVTVNRVKRHIGLFTDELEAAKAYDEAARVLHGDFARLNFGGCDR